MGNALISVPPGITTVCAAAASAAFSMVYRIDAVVLSHIMVQAVADIKVG